MSNIERIYYMLQENDCGHWFRDNADTLKLAEYLDKKGCIAPPINIGSLVYVLRWKRKRTNGKGGYWNSIIETDLQMKLAKENGEIYVDCKKATKSDFLRIGKTVFLTREEAEQALRTPQNDEVRE